MKTIQQFKLIPNLVIGFLFMSFALTSCMYMKMNPSSDADKTPAAVNNSCYLATASNMLAGAGYGTGTTAQARADDIYGDLTAQFGIANGGWTDAALSWWLSSANNTWTNNPYSVVTVYGNKSPRYPWANSNGAMDIANYLRSCNMVGLSISWPTAGSSIGDGGHAITAWGDGGWMPWADYNDLLTANPSNVRVADSDNDSGGNIQQYNYDSYTSPNTGGPNEGNGWYISYSSNHPYIKHIVTLSPTQSASGSSNVQRVVGSYRIQQTKEEAATDLHYNAGTDVEILSYLTRISWDDKLVPAVAENGTPRQNLDVTWDIKNKPIPAGTWVTITTEFMLRNWNAISYDKVYFTYPKITGIVFPPVKWQIKSLEIRDAAKMKNVTGGYIIASFEILDKKTANEKIAPVEYRLVHQYSYNQSPEIHYLNLQGPEGYIIRNLKIGHSYGYPSTNKELWEFKEWLTAKTDSIIELKGKPVEININWKGRLPYPEGEIFEKRLLEIKK